MEIGQVALSFKYFIKYIVRNFQLVEKLTFVRQEETEISQAMVETLVFNNLDLLCM